jgi:hypothetical protein
MKPLVRPLHPDTNRVVILSAAGRNDAIISSSTLVSDRSQYTMRLQYSRDDARRTAVKPQMIQSYTQGAHLRAGDRGHTSPCSALVPPKSRDAEQQSAAVTCGQVFVAPKDESVVAREARGRFHAWKGRPAAASPSCDAYAHNAHNIYHTL